MAMEAMVSLLLKQLPFTLPYPTCDPTPHNTPHVPHLTFHSRPFHCTFPSPSSESKEIERVGGYQFTVTQMPNSFAFGERKRPSSDHMGWRLSFHLSFMSCVELSGTISYVFCCIIYIRKMFRLCTHGHNY